MMPSPHARPSFPHQRKDVPRMVEPTTSPTSSNPVSASHSPRLENPKRFGFAFVWETLALTTILVALSLTVVVVALLVERARNHESPPQPKSQTNPASGEPSTPAAQISDPPDVHLPAPFLVETQPHLDTSDSSQLAAAEEYDARESTRLRQGLAVAARSIRIEWLTTQALRSFDTVARQLDQAARIARQRQQEDQRRRRDAQLADLRAQADRLDAAIVQLQERNQSRRTELAQRARERRERATKTIRTLVPFQGPNGTFHHPLAIECVENQIRILPDGPTFDLAELTGEATSSTRRFARLGGGDQRFLNAVRNRLEVNRSEADHDFNYVLFLVRPTGIRPFYEARYQVENAGLAFGYELVDEDWVFEFPDSTSPTKNILPIEPRPLVTANSTTNLESSSAMPVSPWSEPGSRRGHNADVEKDHHDAEPFRTGSHSPTSHHPPPAFLTAGSPGNHRWPTPRASRSASRFEALDDFSTLGSSTDRNTPGSGPELTRDEGFIDLNLLKNDRRLSGDSSSTVVAGSRLTSARPGSKPDATRRFGLEGSRTPTGSELTNPAEDQVGSLTRLTRINDDSANDAKDGGANQRGASSEDAVNPEAVANQGLIVRPFEITLTCGERGMIVHPGGLRLTRATLATADTRWLDHLQNLVRVSQLVEDPEVILRPELTILVQADGHETYQLIRGKVALSGLAWPVTLRVAPPDPPFARRDW